MRRFASHLLVTLAVFSLTSSLFILVLEKALLDVPNIINTATEQGLDDAIQTVLPKIATEDLPPDEQEEIRSKITAVLDDEYTTKKLTELSEAFRGIVVEGKTEASLDLSDFPQKLRENGVQVDAELEEQFSKPIEISTEGQESPLTTINDAYKRIQFLKWLGFGLFALFIGLELFVAQPGQRLRLVGRVFLHAALWFTFFSVLVIVVPGQLAGKVLPSNENARVLAEAMLDTVQSLFMKSLVTYAVVCAVIALVLYLARFGLAHNKRLHKAAADAEVSAPNPLPNKR